MAFLIFSSRLELGEKIELSLQFLEATSRAMRSDDTPQQDVAVFALSQEVVFVALRKELRGCGLL